MKAVDDGGGVYEVSLAEEAADEAVQRLQLHLPLLTHVRLSVCKLDKISHSLALAQRLG